MEETRPRRPSLVRRSSLTDPSSPRRRKNSVSYKLDEMKDIGQKLIGETSKSVASSGSIAIENNGLVPRKKNSTQYEARIAEATKEKDLSNTMNSVEKCFALWLLGNILGFLVLYFEFYDAPAADDLPLPLEHYSYAAVIYFMSVGYSALSIFTSKSKEQTQLAKILFYTNFIAFGTYFILLLDWTPTYFDHWGHPVHPGRYLQWGCSSPILLYLMAEATDSQDAWKTSVILLKILCCGVASTFSGKTLSNMFMSVAVCHFYYLLKGIYTMFMDAILDKTQSSLDKDSLKMGLAVSFIGWSIMPITWHLQKYGWISYEAGEVLFSVGDIISKPFLTVIFTHAVMKESQEKKHRKLSTVRDDLMNSVQQADNILTKVLPKHLVLSLKEEEGDETHEEFMCVTVVFTDVCNFQALCSTNSASYMMKTMNKFWSEYDILCKKWNVQRVQVVNDQFLGVVGIPDRSPDHAEDALQFSIAVILMANEFCGQNGEKLLVRVGLNSGPVTAGLVGEVNPQWTIIGDTVNVAMDTTSKPMRVHLTEATYNLIYDKGFQIEGPEVTEVKGKGPMTTYWIA
ncbi:UNVERIFIED_CONTAM: hypothetical protein HDU68_002999 [Siphonaria sp. JEL0065]|nr:hypothetical protein HDU68_002999 [Siphonaria sp. JEL0065]